MHVALAVLLLSLGAEPDIDAGTEAPPDAGLEGWAVPMPPMTPGQALRCQADGIAKRQEEIRAAEARPNPTTAQRNSLRAAKPQLAAQIRVALECLKELAADDAQQKAEADHAALVAKRRTDPHWYLPAVSALRCGYADLKEGSLAEIAKEKKYGKTGGVVDNEKLYQLERYIRAADEGTARMDAVLKRAKLAPTACTDKQVAGLTPCVPRYVGSNPVFLPAAQVAPCTDADHAQYVELVTTTPTGE